MKRSPLESALIGLVALVLVFGVSKLLGQTGLVAGWAVLLTYLVDAPGSLRQRAAGMGAFAVFGFAQILLVELTGYANWQFVVLLFAISFACSWMLGFGERAAKLGFVSNLWITLMPALGVSEDLGASLLGFVAGSFLVLIASIVPPLLQGVDTDADATEVLLIDRRTHAYSTLLTYSAVRASAITLAGVIGFAYLELNKLWLALTVTLILSPVADANWGRGLQRAAGTVLGLYAGYLLVLAAEDNTTLLRVIAAIAAFLFLYTAKGFEYGVFVFFLSIFIVAQIGLKGTDMADFGGNERLIATLVGVGIAFVATVFLQLIVRRDSFGDAAETTTDALGTNPAA